MQTRLGSAIEVGANILIGFWINFLANWLILPYLGFHTLDFKTNFLIGTLFTGISVVRGYVLRRWFNHMIVKAANAAAAKIQG
jgi:hypothetical protein